MRIERLRVEAFGGLRGVDTGAAPLPGLVVVAGPNEAGKSTLFHFLTSILYGFYPASREGNLYAPWDGAEPAGSASLRLDGGRCVQVELRLLSAPNGRMESEGRVEELRNRTLPWAEHVPRTVFRQVFAVTLAEMAGLEEETWARVQDRLLGAMGSADLRPARHIIAELEREASEIWRPTRRGNQKAREVGSAIRELRTSRRDALERDRRERELVAELQRIRRELRETREARQAAMLAVDRVQGLIPIRNQLLRIEGLRNDAGPVGALADLPADPAGALEAQEARVRSLGRRVEALAQEEVEPRAAVAALEPQHERLLQHADDVTAFLARASSLASHRQRLATLEQEIRDLGRRAEGAGAQLLAEPLSPAMDAAILAVPVAELRERIRAVHQARTEAHRKATESAQTPPPPPLPSLSAPAAVTLAGLSLAAVGWTGDRPLVTGMGVALLALAAYLARGWLTGRRRRDADGGTVGGAASAEPPGALAESQREVASLLAALPVRPSLLADPSDTLTANLQRVQELLRDRHEREEQFRTLRQELAAADRDAARLAASVGRGEGMDATALVHLLERELRGAERTAERASASRRELQRLTRERRQAEEEAEEAQAALDRLRARLEEAGGGSLERGIQTVRDRIQARDRADQLQDELERAHPDLDEIRQRIRTAEAQGESWTVDDDDLAKRKAAVEDLTQKVESMATRAEALDKDVTALRSDLTVDAVDGEIAALQEEEAALLRERDRRWVMAQLLREADRRFREEHQPDVLRRAGTNLSVLTGGRYDRLMVDESSGSGRFQVTGPGLPEPMTLAPPVSTGTLEQAYLALRLAIVDHLDQGLERLPLFVDEVLVNWDGHRMARGMDLLEAMARRRQGFVFTCHDDLSGALASRGAGVIRLDQRR